MATTAIFPKIAATVMSEKGQCEIENKSLVLFRVLVALVLVRLHIGFVSNRAR
jgi:hypothetical protein